MSEISTQNAVETMRSSEETDSQSRWIRRSVNFPIKIIFRASAIRMTEDSSSEANQQNVSEEEYQRRWRAWIVKHVLIRLGLGKEIAGFSTLGFLNQFKPNKSKDLILHITRYANPFMKVGFY